MLRHNQKGAATIELAIVLPILVLLVFGAIEFGLLFYNKQVITNASREGARAGITDSADSDAIKTIVINYCLDRMVSLKDPIVISVNEVKVIPPDSDNDLTVNVTFGYSLLFSPIIGITSTTVSGQTVMRMEPPL
jgi:Flp pilus assembly protein TadG